MTVNWDAMVKTYDVRGLVNIDLTEDVVEALAAGFVDELELAGKSVVVVGVSYKANIADTRETPAAAVIDLLRENGATVTWHDDLVGSWRGEATAPLKGDLAVLVTRHDGLDLAALETCSYLFDCTGTVPGADGV